MGVRSRSSAGGAQLNLNVTDTVVTLTVPATAMCAVVYVRATDDGGTATGPVSYTTNGTDPTANIGIVANPGDIILLNSREELENFRVVEQTATDAEVGVEYFTDLSG